ncbi:MAG TPA: beta-galactosidase trimerization domain-containing protein [Oscillospiraceae bacterium]|nr:beta-galactosidase trimerization domain-containing protein [Oscillospiraceae bacterium]HPF55659.1 beta-galactosidase trimerization domain-containing protein [Clostridiales bacterium]HPK34723.1 beta-galactosidase trimerization domain-containing protein [Oscillospiraceae bacterium]HPR76055.1 beta-galactosidase trimerization domain-containing protein [Oscillospiraceae bacterium]
MMKWWEDEPRLISAVQCNYGADDNWLFDEYVSKSGFNTEQLLHLFAEGSISFYDEKKHGKKLDVYLKKAHAKGIREIVYYNTHCLKREMMAEHPDWMQLLKDGKPMLAYNIYAFSCVNSPWFDDFAKNIADLCRHDIDGLFLDGPVMREDGCYCPVCQRIFQEKFGKTVAEGTYLEHLQMRIDSVTEFVRKTYEIVKSVNPNVLLYLNNSALRRDYFGCSIRRVEPYLDMLGAEGGFVRADATTSLWAVSSKAKHLETLSRGKPVVTFVNGNMSGVTYYMHTPAETTALCAQSFANGANVWYGIHGDIEHNAFSPGAKASAKFNEFVNAHRDVYQKSACVSEIALMWSQDTANNYSSSIEQCDFIDAKAAGFKERGDHLTELMGFYDILTRAHIQFDIIDEVKAKEDLSKYKLVILPDCACMDDETAAALAKFVENGGEILSTFDTGFYNADGSYAKAPKLAAVQGIAAVKEIVAAELPGMAYQRPNESQIFKDVNLTLMPSPQLAVRCELAGDAVTLSTALEPLISVYIALPETGYPGIVEHTCGKGRSVYISGALGKAYSERSLPPYAKIVENIARRAAKPVFETDAPRSVEAVLRRQKNGRYILHMINLTGEMIRPMTKILPLENIKVTVKIKGVKTVKALRGGKLRDLEIGEKKVSFSLPKLNDFEIVVFEPKK